jgi:hypothetical protein
MVVSRSNANASDEIHIKPTAKRAANTRLFMGRTPQMTEIPGDGNGNTLSPEPPAPRCSWHLRQAVTVTVSDDSSTSC